MSGILIHVKLLIGGILIFFIHESLNKVKVLVDMISVDTLGTKGKQDPVLKYSCVVNQTHHRPL